MIKKLSTICAVLLISAGLILFPDSTRKSACEALILCGRVLIPSLFPFLVLSSFIIKAQLTSSFKNASVNVFILGLLGGYPVGASCVCEMYMQKQLSKEKAERLLTFCNNCGPAFIFGAVGGGIFKSLKIGVFLYVIHILSAILVALIFNRKEDAALLPATPENGAFPNAVKSAVSGTLNICAFVIFFSVLCEILTNFNILPVICKLFGNSKYTEAIIIGILEMTSGIYKLSATRECIVISAFLLGFGGFSVHSQALAFISDAKLSSKKYFYGKTLQAIFSLILALSALTLNII